MKKKFTPEEKREATEQAVESARDRIKAEFASEMERDLNFQRIAPG